MAPDAPRKPLPGVDNQSPQVPEPPATILARYGPSVYDLLIYDQALNEHKRHHTGIDYGVQMTDAQAIIRSRYFSGIKFFTKEAIQNLDNQLKSTVESGQNIQVRGINGLTVDLEIETGRTYRNDSDHAELERYLIGPLIQYVTFQDLTLTSQSFPFVPRLAYCNLRLQFVAIARHRLTKRIFYRPLRPYEAIKTSLEKTRDYWNTTQASAELKSLLGSSVPHCDKIIAFGLGEIARANDKNIVRHAYEHIILLAVRDALNGNDNHKKKIACYSQEPTYSDVDVSLLAAFGVTAVRDPQGFLLADESSAIISFRAMAPVKSIICDLTRPAIMIWEKVTDDDPHFAVTNDDEPRVRMMIQNQYKRFEFPGNNGYSKAVAIYVRKPSSNSVW